MAGTLPPGGSSMPSGKQVKVVTPRAPGMQPPNQPATVPQNVPPAKLPATGKG